MTLTKSLKLSSLIVVAAAAWPALAETSAAAQPHTTITQSAVPAILDEAVRYQLDDFKHSNWALRYRMHRVDTKDDVVRDLIESSDGNVSRTLSSHGKPLTPEEETAEEERLRSITAADMTRHRHNGDSTEKFGVELIKALPQAMNFTLAPGQPQLPNVSQPQIVLDFAPNPEFHPANTTQSLLQGIAGHVWIDAENHHLVRIEVTIIHNLNLMFGILARVYEGGTLAYDQRPVGGGHYAYSHIDINVRMRELMVKVVPYHSTYDATDVMLLPRVPNFKEATEMLLAGPPKP